MKISIIVTVYNLENEILQCLSSINNQTVNNFEVIIINDGSTDNSFYIISSFCEKHTNFKQILIENSGVTRARQLGINHSHGDYIIFVDGDDLLPPTAIESLTSKDSLHEYDIVIGSYITKKNIKIKKFIYKNECITGYELAKKYISGEIMGSPCMKLYNKKLFLDCSFNFNRDIKRGEDLLMNLELCKRAKNIKIINKIVYVYVLRNNSTMNSFITTASYERKFRHLISTIVNKYNLTKAESSNFNKTLHLAEIKGYLYAYFSNMKNNHDNCDITSYFYNKKLNFYILCKLNYKYKIVYLSLFSATLNKFLKLMVKYS